MMVGLTMAACCVAVSALIVGLRRRPKSRDRLWKLHGGPEQVSRSHRRDWSGLVTALVAVLAGVAVAVVIEGWLGIAGGVVTAAVVGRMTRRWESAAVRRARQQASADLPFAADLLAAGLRAGAPTATAVAAVAEVWGGPLGERLDRVASALRLGSPASEAWEYLGDVAGASRLITAAVRSSESGAALANALVRVSDDLRADQVHRAEAAARRAGVLVVLPLALCFLPAFVIAGLVPLIIALLRQVAG